MRVREERWLPWLLWIMALLPRLSAIGRYITPDELIWVYRSVLFREAVRHGAWAETLVSGHPGVVTTWLGTIGISLQLWLHPPSRAVYTWLTQLAWWAPDNMAAFQQLSHFLTAGRLLAALVNSAGVVAAFLLVRKLWGRRIGLLFALLLALDPFFAGLSGLLHVDGLMTTFATLSLLSLCVWMKLGEPDGKRPFLLVAAAASAALALVTKSPAVLLLPLTLLFLALRWLLIVRRERQPSLLYLVRPALLWSGVLLLVVLSIFPALWDRSRLGRCLAAMPAVTLKKRCARPFFSVPLRLTTVLSSIRSCWRFGWGRSRLRGRCWGLGFWQNGRCSYAHFRCRSGWR